MSKRDDLKKGFDSLLKTTDINDRNITTNAHTPKRLNSQTSKSENGAKYKELKKCTLYLPPELMDALAIMKVKTKKDLSELTAVALKEYLVKNDFLNI